MKQEINICKTIDGKVMWTGTAKLNLHCTYEPLTVLATYKGKAYEVKGNCYCKYIVIE